MKTKTIDIDKQIEKAVDNHLKGLRAYLIDMMKQEDTKDDS